MTEPAIRCSTEIMRFCTPEGGRLDQFAVDFAATIIRKHETEDGTLNDFTECAQEVSETCAPYSVHTFARDYVAVVMKKHYPGGDKDA